MSQRQKKNGKVIDNFNCYLVTVLNSDAAKKTEIGNKATITLSSGNEITAEVKYISEENDGNA